MRQDSLLAQAETHSMFSQGQPSPRCQDPWARGCAGDPGGLALSTCSGLWVGAALCSLVGPAPAWAQGRKAVPSRGRSGWAHVQLLALQPSSVARAQHTSAQRPQGPQEQPYEDWGWGWPETQCDRCSAFSGHRSWRQHSLFTILETRGRKTRLRSYTQDYFYFSKSCLVRVEGYKAFLLFPSVLHP